LYSYFSCACYATCCIACTCKKTLWPMVILFCNEQKNSKWSIKFVPGAMGQKAAPLQAHHIFLVASPKKMFQRHHWKHITFSSALNTWQKSHKVLRVGLLQKFSCALNRAMLYSMNMKKISSGPLTLYSLPQMKNCATRYRSYSTKLSVFRNRLHLAKALPLRFL